MNLLIPVAAGIESAVKRQLEKLGYPDCKAYNGRVKVPNCSFYDVALLNLCLRAGERVLINVAEFAADNFDALYEGVKAVPWEQFFTPHFRVTVVTKSVRSTLFAHNAIQSIAKKALVDRLSAVFGTSVDEDGANATVEIDLTDDVARVNVDTSGDGLHKRGYRTASFAAPLRETTAAALIDFSVWNRQKTFADVFCGSGTLPIEAALISQNIAPGKNRSFAFENWDCADKTEVARARQFAADSEKPFPVEILASDISAKAVEKAKFHAQKAGVGHLIRFSAADAKDFYSSASYGVCISNPPYGERMGEESDVRKIALFMGKVYRRLDNWNFYFITPFEQFEKSFGRTANRKRKIYNAGIKCCYYSFNGSKPPKDN